VESAPHSPSPLQTSARGIHPFPDLEDDTQATSLRLQLASYEAESAKQAELCAALEAELQATREYIESQRHALETAVARAEQAERQRDGDKDAGQAQILRLEQTWELHISANRAQSAWERVMEVATTEKDTLNAERETLNAALNSLHLAQFLVADK